MIGHKEHKKGNGKEKGKGENKGKGQGKKDGQNKGARNFPTAPDHEDPMVMMRTQMEICKLKSERKIVMDVSKEWFGAMEEQLLQENPARLTGTTGGLQKR